MYSFAHLVIEIGEKSSHNHGNTIQWRLVIVAYFFGPPCGYCKNVNLHLELHHDNITRGHSLKLVNSRCFYDLRKFLFSVRIVNIWNSLPASVNSANNVNTFKNRLDRFWTNQELMYDYKNSLTRIGNRSAVDNFDDTIFSFIIMLWICNKRQKRRQCVLTRYVITRVSVNTRSRELFARIIRVSVKRRAISFRMQKLLKHPGIWQLIDILWCSIYPVSVA